MNDSVAFSKCWDEKILVFSGLVSFGLGRNHEHGKKNIEYQIPVHSGYFTYISNINCQWN